MKKAVRLVSVFICILLFASLVMFVSAKGTEGTPPKAPMSAEYKAVEPEDQGPVLTVCLSDTSNVVKYNITTLEENVNWDNIDTYITDKNNVLYPKGDCFINICGYTKDLEYNEVLVYEFKFSKFIETAIRTKNVEILKHLFGYQPIEVNFPDGVCDILYDGQVRELYDYLVNYNYHIQSVTTERHAEDIFSERYPIIRLITLSK